MKLSVDFKNIVTSQGVKDFIVNKSESLKKYVPQDSTVHWMVIHEKGQSQYGVHLHLLSGHVNYFSESHEHNIRSAITSAIRKLETQLRKKKESYKAQKYAQRVMRERDLRERFVSVA